MSGGGSYWGDGAAAAPFSALGLAMNGGGAHHPAPNQYNAFSGGRPPPALPPHIHAHGHGGGHHGGGGAFGAGVTYGGGGQQMAAAQQYSFAEQQRQGSLSQSQQMELMGVLESEEGLGEIDAFLGAPMGLGRDGMEGVRWA